VRPQAGALLLFRHRLMHRGDPVTAGVKYAIRSDVMYRTDD
jgi:predicted 2-oxoglutarate/Fe(II)-dependent dioxygenase YbiX